MAVVGIVKDWLLRSNKLERLWLLAKIEFKLRYYENKLGLFWALLKPVMDVSVYYIAFKVILSSDVPAFASYLFSGLIIWNFFLESTTGTIQILNTKKFLYEYSNMNKVEIYISTLLSNTIGFFFNLITFLLFYIFLERDSAGITINVIWMLPIFINLFILSLAMSLILSCCYILMRDITQIWQVFTSFLFFLSPIFYKLSVFQEKLPNFDYGNPIAGVIINTRRVLLERSGPDYKLLIFDFCYAIFLLLIGIILLNKLGSRAAEKL